MFLPKVYRTLRDAVQQDPQSGYNVWPDDNDGILIEGLGRSRIFFDHIQYCKTGIHIVSTSDTTTGTSWNEFNLGWINGCETGIWLDVKARDSRPNDVTPGNGVDGGWINENTFVYGLVKWEATRFDYDLYPQPGVVGIKLTGFYNELDGVNQGAPGHNRFWRTGVEGATAEYDIWCEGDHNAFHDVRHERHDPADIYPANTEGKILLRRPADAPSIGWRFAQHNEFSGLNMQRWTDPSDDYGRFEFDANMQYTTGDNYAFNVLHIGRADEAGGGWVRVNPDMYV